MCQADFAFSNARNITPRSIIEEHQAIFILISPENLLFPTRQATTVPNHARNNPSLPRASIMVDEPYDDDAPLADDSKLDMQQACEQGDLPILQRLMQKNGRNLKASGIVSALLKTAVECQHPHLVDYLLSTCPDLSLSQRTDIVASLLKTSNTRILNLLLSHDPGFASISIDYGMRTFLTDACSQPPSKINPLIHILLDAGADVNDGMGPGGGALLAALLGEQAKDVIIKILRRGAFVGNSVLDTAIRKERADILKMLWKRGGSNVDMERAVRTAREGGNKRVIEILEDFGGEKMEVTVIDKSERVGEERRWWKFLGR
ncbi:MAG: hypothetical protein CL912_25750 [Deltaproteobacteria bacterium]|nr:hypothetical protein [Deltaproteobacteria bacterium]MAD86377.1 hypothetical protein [Deltaproteobacteria bacterium]